VGVLTHPAAGRATMAVIIFNAGLLHRVGPARLSVKLARALAAHGFLALRFDHGNRGDSRPDGRYASFVEAALAEAGEVMDDLTTRCGVGRFILVGLCSGAITAFKTAARDARVAGAVLINSQVYESDPNWNRYVLERSYARYYVTRSLHRPSSWWRALTGRINYRRLWRVMIGQLRRRIRPDREARRVAEHIAAELNGTIERGGRLLLVFSEGDRGIDYFHAIFGRELKKMPQSSRLQQMIIKDADHTFIGLHVQKRLIDAITRWCDSLLAETGQGDALATGAGSRPPMQE
jgi:pimeloyl-ACP methyl ester carboxylesterase